MDRCCNYYFTESFKNNPKIIVPYFSINYFLKMRGVITYSMFEASCIAYANLLKEYKKHEQISN